jgi:hypothetical protein
MLQQRQCTGRGDRRQRRSGDERCRAPRSSRAERRALVSMALPRGGRNEMSRLEFFGKVSLVLTVFGGLALMFGLALIRLHQR